MQRNRPHSYIVQPIIAATILAFLSPLLAFAGSRTPAWTNTDGHSAILSSGAFNLAGSEITGFAGVPTTGSLNLTTGATFTGRLTTGGPWSPGGTITMTPGGLDAVFQTTFKGTSNVAPPAVAAEPGSLALMGTGFLAVGVLARRRFRSGRSV